MHVRKRVRWHCHIHEELDLPVFFETLTLANSSLRERSGVCNATQPTEYSQTPEA